MKLALLAFLYNFGEQEESVANQINSNANLHLSKYTDGFTYNFLIS